MNKPIISVILTTFNRCQKYLPRAIKSVLNQTFKEFELLIIDDASTDKTSQVVASFKDKRIRYYKIPHFGCDTRPKNIGAKRSKGEYLAYLDDDNTFRPDHLQALFNCLEKNPKIVVAYGDRWVHFEGGEQKDQIGIYFDFDVSHLMQQNYIDTSDVLIRKEALFEVGGWDEKLTKFIDWNLWVRMAKRGYLFKRVPIILTDYSLHENQKSILNKEGRFDAETGLFTPTFEPFQCKINAECLGGKKEFKVAIFTLTKNRLEYTQKMAESMFKTAGYPFDWFVVDQGSDDGTKEWLKEQKIKKIIFNEKNMGIPYASNQIIEEIKKGDYDFIIKADNDVWFKSFGWLRAMMGIYECIRPIALSLYPEGLIDNAGGVYRYNYAHFAGELIGLVVHLGGMTTIVPAEVYDEFKWPEVAFLRGGNDVLLSSWLNTNSYQLAYLENYQAEHLETTHGQQEKFPEYFELAKKEMRTRTSEYLKTGKYYGSKRYFKVKIKINTNELSSK